MFMKFLSTKAVSDALGLSSTASFTAIVHKYKIAGNVGRNRWNMEKVCRDLITKTKRGATWDAANKYLSGVGKEEKKKTVAPTQQESPIEVHHSDTEDAFADETQRPPIDDPENIELGLEGAVSRLRHYEQRMASRLSMEMRDGNNIAGAYRDWITAVEQMRKSESELLDVLARRKTLVPVDQVKELFLRMIETTKGLLLVMPAKLAGELEGMEWSDIQKRLDGEIRDILTNLTTSATF